jgi:hypothetical protein
LAPYLAGLLAIALVTQGRLVEVWECSMSGTRDCPCECSQHASEWDDVGDAAGRPACCEAHEEATVTAALVTAALDIAIPPNPVDDAWTPVGFDTSADASRARGPPPPTIRKFIVHRSLLL